MGTTIRDIYGHEHALPGPYKTMNEIKRANENLGRFFFSPDTMQFFDSRVEGGPYHGRLFVTSEQFHGSQGDGPRKFKVRVCGDDGDCETLIDEEFDDEFDAEQAIEELVADDDYEAQGAAAFAAGEDRMVPRDILVGDDERVGMGNGIENAKAWYRGWDRANLAAPIEEEQA